MDRAETLRAALTRQRLARTMYLEVKARGPLPEESPEQFSERLHGLEQVVLATDAEMSRLRPERPRTNGPSTEQYHPPIEPGLSN